MNPFLKVYKMRIYGRRHLTWNKKEKNLSLGKEVLCKLQPHPECENLYYIHWTNGTKSEDYYNLNRAIEHSFRECLKELNNTTEDT